ncbi:MAG: hypothetical protein JW751_20290 [Polyangiaceae bacterium]|nr:hypothetical protein [Polyangiaceae bacterium]
MALGSDIEQAAAAEALFDEGLELLDRGELERACAKLHASLELDPGVGTLMYLAECHRRLGRNTSAWTRFLEAAALARATQQPARGELAQARADELAPSLSRLTVKVSPQAARAGVQVLRGGLVLEPETWGSALPVDPGTYEIVATAPGYQPFRRTVHLGRNGDQVVAEIPALLPERVEPASGQEPIADPPTRAHDQEVVDRRALHPVTWGLAGLTLVGAALGTSFAVWAESIEANALRDCEPGPKCAPNELDELERARKRASVAHGSFAVASVTLVAATIWEIHARRSTRSGHERGLRWGLAAVNPLDSPLPRGAQVTLHARFE